MWSFPQKLRNYSQAPREIGVYLIGEMIPVPPLTEAEAQDNFLGKNWPDGFFPHYIGMSYEKKCGVRRRLSCHARGRGNVCIAKMIRDGKDLYYICRTGPENLLSERMLQASLGGGTLSCNTRIEYMRRPDRLHDLVHEYFSRART